MKSLTTLISAVLFFFLSACGGSNAEKDGKSSEDKKEDKKEKAEKEDKKDKDEKEDKGPDPLAIGDELPMKGHKMKGVDGKKRSLGELAGENGLLVNFTCNTCPFVKAWDDRYTPLQKLAEKKKLGHVLLNPNTKKRDDGDSFEDMKAYAEENHPSIPYLLDEKSKVANAFGAKTTPHIFLFDEDLKLVYRGKIDKSHKKSYEEAEEPYLENAIAALTAGEQIDPEVTDAVGCSIKRP